MGLQNFPVELLEQVVCFIESSCDLASFALANKLFSDIARPHFSRFLTFGIPYSNGGWSLQGPFNRITEQQLHRVRHIEVMHSSEVKRWGSNDIRVGFPTEKEYEAMKKFLSQEELARECGSLEDPDMAPTIFNEKLAQLIGKLRPGQLESFRFDRHSYSRVFFGIEIDTQILKALNAPQTRLTKLTLAFDPCVRYDDCSVFNFPHLLYFRYSCYDVAKRYHRIFSLLSSCQDTLEELYVANWQPAVRRYHTDTTQMSSCMMTNGFDAWKECGNCTQLCRRVGANGEKRIHLKNLKKWQCHGHPSYSYEMAKLFQREKILENVKLSKFKENGSISILHSGHNSDSTVGWEKYFSYPSLDGCPSSPQELSDFFGSTTGFKEVSVLGLYIRGNCWEWIEGLRKGHLESLRKLKPGTWALSTDDDDVEYIGKSLSNLEELVVLMKQSIWTDPMPDCVFDKAIFPKLRSFKSTNQPSKKDLKLREKLCQKIFDSVSQGKLSPNLEKIYVGKANYVFTIERDNKHYGEANNGTELEEMVFNGELTLEEALERYGIRVTETVNTNRRAVWMDKDNEVYE
ncbi:hypothetical protein TWF281_009733 [Arthrobotrys megalospora]